MSTPLETVVPVIAPDVLSTDHLHVDLKGRSVRGGVFTLTSQGAQFIIQSLSTIVLARLLTPAAFGMVAMVTAVTGLGSAFADLGLSEATIQRKEISQDQISTLFWINVAIGLGLTVVTMAMAPVFVWFYKQPELKDITLVMSLTFLISGLRVQHDALLKRQMRFLALAIRDIASMSVAVPVAIILAWRGFGYWALVAQPLILNATQVTLTWVMVRWMPGLPRRNAEIGGMVAFGGNVAASYLISNINRNVDNVLVGWYWGAGPLGLYSRAYNLLMLPVRQLSGPTGSVAVPAFSRIQTDPERFARYYLRVVNLMTWISTPIFGFLFVAANSVIMIVLGKQWLGAAPVFQILAISALGQLLLDSTMWLLVSRGQSRRLLRFLLIASPILIGSFLVGLPFGIKGVALSGSLALVCIFPWILTYTFRGTELTLRRVGQAILYPISTCCFCVVLGEIVLHILKPSLAVMQLVIVALTFVAGYSLSMLVSPIRHEVASLKRLLKELRHSGASVA
jgi:O-antigen/teichoic acid export membrane protein